jgi:hypothetical protein
MQVPDQVTGAKPCALNNAASFPPEVLEPVRHQNRVGGRAGDRAMTEPALDRPGVMALAVRRSAALTFRTFWSTFRATAQESPAGSRRDHRIGPFCI